MSLEKSLVSVNQLKTWGRCRKKFYYDYVQKLRWPTDPSNFRLGTQVHKLMDFQARELSCQDVLRDADTDVLTTWKKLMEHPLAHLPVLANEWAFLVPVETFWLTGRIDRIAQKGDQILIIDWKTGTGIPKNPQEDWQTLVYLYATVETFQDLGLSNLSPEDVQFVYLQVSTEIREVVIPYDTLVHQRTHQLLKETFKCHGN